MREAINDQRLASGKRMAIQLAQEHWLELRLRFCIIRISAASILGIVPS